MVIRELKGTDEDLEFLLSVRNDYSTRYYLENDSIFKLEDARVWYRNIDPPWLLMEKDAVKVGYIRRTKEGEVGIDIHPEHRRHGHARQGYRMYLEDKTFASLWVFEDNIALKLYEELGFVRNGNTKIVRNRPYIEMVYQTIQPVKLYGLEFSGSHYLHQLMELNFDSIIILHSHLGWKHGKIKTKFSEYPKDWGVRADVLLDVFSDGKTYTDHQHHLKKVFPDIPHVILMRSPFVWVAKYINFIQNTEGNILDIKSLVDRWNETNRNYFETDVKKIIIKYESLRDNVHDNIISIADTINRPIKHEKVLGYKLDFKQTRDRLKNVPYSNDDSKAISHCCYLLGISLKEYYETVSKYLDFEINKQYENL